MLLDCSDGKEFMSCRIERIVYSDRGMRPLYIHESGYTHIIQHYALRTVLDSYSSDRAKKANS